MIVLTFLDRLPILSKISTLETRILQLDSENKALQKELQIVGYNGAMYITEEHDPKFKTIPKSKILKYCDHSPLIQPIHNAIIREITNAEWEIKPLFNFICTNCGQKFDKRPESGTCDCGGTIREPDISQKKKFENFIDNPNPDVDLHSIIRSVLKWVLSIDDYYVSVSHIGEDENGNLILFKEPIAIFVEDALAIEKIDKSHEEWGYFCPLCNIKGNGEISKSKGVCKIHKNELWETAYIIRGSNTIARRYSKKEIIEGHFNRRLPNKYGTPIIQACVDQIEATLNLDLWNRDSFEKGTLSKIFAFEGKNQDEVQSLAETISSMAEKRKKSGSKLFNLFMGNDKGKIEIHDVLSDPSKLQSLEWHRYYRDMLLSNYGVTPVFAGTVESGKAGNNPMLQIDVMADTTKAWMKVITEPFNRVLMPALNITDWYFDFAEIEVEDDEHKATVEKIKAETIAIYTQAGYEVDITEEGIHPRKKDIPNHEQMGMNIFGKMSKQWHDYVPDTFFDEIQDSLSAISGKYESNVEKIMEEYNQTADRSKMISAIEQEVNDAAKALDTTLRHYLFPIYQDAYKRIWRQYSKILSKAALDKPDPYALAYLQEYFDEYETPFMRSWTEREKQRIFQIIEEEAEKGYNHQNVAKRLKDYFGIRDRYYWKMVARTEGTRAFIEAGTNAAKELGASEKRLVFRDDDVGCEECAAEAMMGWQPLNSPNKIPLHPHCRCYYEYRSESMREDGYD